MWPAGWNETRTSPSAIACPYGRDSIGTPGPNRRSSRRRDGSAQRYAWLPGRAWSPWAWVMRARSTGPQGSTWKPPAGQKRPAGLSISIGLTHRNAVARGNRRCGSLVAYRARRALMNSHTTGSTDTKMMRMATAEKFSFTIGTLPKM